MMVAMNHSKEDRKKKANDASDDGDDSSDEDSSDEERDPDNDPDGTARVARGGWTPRQVARTKRQQAAIAAMAAADPRVHQRTMDLLQQDDAAPDTCHLNEKQRHAQQKRQQRRSNNKLLDATLARHDAKRRQAAVAVVSTMDVLQTATAGLLEPETDMERTTALTQTALRRLDPSVASFQYNLQLSQYAPYGLAYDLAGRHAVLFGRKGHVAVLDCHHTKLVTELFVHETVRDACFLNNMMAVAQKNHVYVYDQQSGAELHKLNDHIDPMALQYLPHHWLLASLGRAGYLHYQDMSTGQVVSKHHVRNSSKGVLRQNPSNAVLHAGHVNGTVTLWSPGNSKYLAKGLCHKGAAVTALAIDEAGHTMVTGGADRQIKVWDLRMLFRQRHAYCSVGGIPTSLDISQRNLLGIGHGCHATFWSAEALQRKVKDPYMHHSLAGKGLVETLRFRPYQDVVGIGHAAGISSIVVPGSGEPHLDTVAHATNPFADTRQRRETVVRSLLDKLEPDMITLEAVSADAVVGGISVSNDSIRLDSLQQQGLPVARNKKVQKRRGRSKIQTALRRKHRNVVDCSTLKLRAAREQEKAVAEERQNQDKGDSSSLHEETTTSRTDESAPPTALKRFFS